MLHFAKSVICLAWFGVKLHQKAFLYKIAF